MNLNPSKMTVRLFKVFSIDTFHCNFQQVRYGHRIRGKPPTIARNLKQRLEELNYKDPSISFEVNIGFNESKLSKKQLMQQWITDMEKVRKSSIAEKKARNKELIIDLNQMKKDWQLTKAPIDVERVARHYGVFKDLFGDAYFKPIVPLNVNYHLKDINVGVHYGNILKPSEASTRPVISYESNSKDLWTLLMTTPDNHFTHPDKEYCHWFIGNIPGNDLAKGEQLIDYLQPFPPRGSGYGRYIFILYKQTKPIDYSEYKKTQPCLSLKDRDWKTLDFYRKYQDDITPAGLAFFQADWEESLIDFYHNTLNMPHPTFEYDFPQPYIKPQTWFPIREAFNLYLDRYRDRKEINKELVLKKLKKTHPFKVLEPPLKYPAAQRLDHRNLPTWYRVALKKERVGGGWINSIK